MKGVGHLVVRAPNWVGDLVMATPVLEAAIGDPRFERVSIAVREHLVDVLADGPLVEHVVPLAPRADEAAVLRELGADAVLLLTNSFGSALRAWRSGASVRIGAALAGRGLLLTHRLVPPRHDGRRVPIPTAHLLRDVAGLAGIAVPDLQPRLHVAPGAVEAQRARLVALGLGIDEPYVVCAPGAAFGAAKLWPPTHFAAALDELQARHGLRAVVSGGPGEEAQMAAVVDAARRPAISLAGEVRDLRTLKALVAGADLLLVGDSGPRWVAAAFGVPCVTVMGPNFPELTASSLESCEVVRLDGLECAPCLERRCPLDHHACLQELPPALAVAAAGRLLARPSSGANRMLGAPV